MRFPNADLTFALHTTVEMVRAVAAKRAVFDAEPDGPTNFWRVIQASLYDTAIVNWCVLFGSDHENHQQLHWKHMFVEEEFRRGLLEAVAMTREGWREYWNHIKVYRDENAAHRALDPKTETYPNFDPALEATFFYNEQLRPKLAAIGALEARLSLRDEYQKCLTKFGEMARIAVAATNA